MTDLELLEKAAKAAGMALGKAQDGVWFYCDHGRCGAGLYRISGNLMEFWNGLTDDGDALRLAVKLGLHISQQLSYATVCSPHGSPATRGISWSEPYDAESPYAATRRAIVRAAAAMAKD